MSVQNYLLLNYSLLNLTGMCKIKKHRAVKKYLHYLWRITVYVNIFYFCFATLLYILFEEADDFQELFLCYISFACSLIIFIRLNYFYAFDGLTEEVYVEMRRLFKYKTQTGFNDKTLQKSITLVNILTYLWVAFCIMGAMGVASVPLIFGKYSARKLSFSMWFPFDWKASPYYQLTIAYQTMVMLMMSFCVIAADMFLAGCIVLTSAQFELLGGWELKYLVQSVLLKHGISEFLEDKAFESKEGAYLRIDLKDIDAITGSEDFSRDLLNGLNRLVQFHQSLMKFCKFLEDFFSPVYLPYVVFGAASSVFMAFNFTIFQKSNIGVIITSGLMLSLIMITLFWPCYLGQLLLTQTENFCDDIYSALWYLGDEKFKANLKIMCCAARKPIRLTLGKFSYLSLQMYLKLINSVVSYAIVLRQITSLNQQAE